VIAVHKIQVNQNKKILIDGLKNLKKVINLKLQKRKTKFKKLLTVLAIIISTNSFSQKLYFELSQNVEVFTNVKTNTEFGITKTIFNNLIHIGIFGGARFAKSHEIKGESITIESTIRYNDDYGYHYNSHSISERSIARYSGTIGRFGIKLEYSIKKFELCCALIRTSQIDEYFIEETEHFSESYFDVTVHHSMYINERLDYRTKYILIYSSIY
jgi:hypothetical protein